jgi:cell division transport system permease protein
MIARYFRLHLQSLAGAFGRLGNTPLGAALNVLVVAIALALPAAMQVLLTNIGNMAPAFEDSADFTVYLELSVDEDRGRDLAQAIGSRPDVESTRFISNIEGLAELKTRAGFGDALDSLSENPLPHVIKLRPRPATIARLEALAAELDMLDSVEFVQLDRQWIERLQSILALGGRMANIVTVLLAAAVLLVIGNTIRLEINNRRTEIEVLKLVGATDGFVRRPFLYTGFCLGLLGALVAVGLVSAGLLLLAAPVRSLAALYATDFSLAGLGLEGTGILIGGGAVLGWAGAWIAAARHLRAIEPV